MVCKNIYSIFDNNENAVVTGTIDECAEYLGVCTGTIYTRRRRGTIDCRYVKRVINGENKNQYDVYDRKDNYICGGTYDEIIKFMGIKRNTFYVNLIKTQKGIDTKWRIYHYEEEDE